LPVKLDKRDTRADAPADVELPPVLDAGQDPAGS